MAKTRTPKKDKIDRRPWHERAGTLYYKAAPGSHRLKMTAEPSERETKWGKLTVDIPTDKGTFSTGAYGILRPLAAYRAKHKKTAGATLTFTQKGKGLKTVYSAVVVK